MFEVRNFKNVIKIVFERYVFQIWIVRHFQIHSRHFQNGTAAATVERMGRKTTTQGIKSKFSAIGISPSVGCTKICRRWWKRS